MTDFSAGIVDDDGPWDRESTNRCEFVKAVLLPDGRWHEVDRSSFEVSYEDCMWRELDGWFPAHELRKEDLCFSFIDADSRRTITGPLASVQAVQWS